MKLTLQLTYLPISKQLVRSYLKQNPRQRRLSYVCLSAGRKPVNQLLKTQQTCPYSVPVEAVSKNHIFPFPTPAMSSAEPMQPGEGGLDAIHL